MWWIMLLTMTLRSVASSVTTTACEEARFRCAQREGCGNALHNYMAGCSAVLRGVETKRCPEVCKNALIALTSTEEGKALMTCDCSDEYCEDTKQRVEVCRSQVMMAHHDDTIVTCDVAQMICQADSACSTAFDYYEDYCKAMFNGRKCTKRCKNSIYVLQRQLKSKKLKNCVCDGPNSFECLTAQRNREKLCIRQTKKPKGRGDNRKEHQHNKYHGSDNRYHNHHHGHNVEGTDENSNNKVEIHVTKPVVRGDVFTNDFKTIPRASDASTLLKSYVLVTFLIVTLLCAS